MRTTLTLHGPDVVLVLDRSIRERLKLAPDAEVDVEVRADELVIRPAAPPEPDPVRDAFQRVIDDPGDLGLIKVHPARSPGEDVWMSSFDF